MKFVPCRKLGRPLQYRKQTSQGQALGSQTEIFQVLVPLFGHLEVLQVCLAHLGTKLIINSLPAQMVPHFRPILLFWHFFTVDKSKWVNFAVNIKIVKLPTLGNDGKSMQKHYPIISEPQWPTNTVESLLCLVPVATQNLWAINTQHDTNPVLGTGDLSFPGSEVRLLLFLGLRADVQHIVPSDEGVSIFVLQLAIHILLRLFHG